MNKEKKRNTRQRSSAFIRTTCLSTAFATISHFICQKMPSSIAYVVIYLAVKCAEIHGMIDVNLRELEYLAARLDPFECRRLIAALHYTTYDLPQNLAAAGKVLLR